MSTLAFIREKLDEMSTIIDQLKEEVDTLIGHAGDDSLSLPTPQALNFDSLLDESSTDDIRLNANRSLQRIREPTSRTVWTDAETIAFRRFISQGKAYSEIARLLDKTPQQIRDKRKTENRRNRI
jgi:hypothetical protein